MYEAHLLAFLAPRNPGPSQCQPHCNYGSEASLSTLTQRGIASVYLICIQIPRPTVRTCFQAQVPSRWVSIDRTARVSMPPAVVFWRACGPTSANAFKGDLQISFLKSVVQLAGHVGSGAGYSSAQRVTADVSPRAQARIYRIRRYTSSGLERAPNG